MPPNWESSSAVFVCKRKAFAQHLGVLGRHCVHFANRGILFKDHLAVACGEDLQRVAAADALGAAGSRCGKWMHIFSFRAVRACILWAKRWTALAAAAASICTGPSAAGSQPGGTPPAAFSGSGKNSRPGAEMMSGIAGEMLERIKEKYKNYLYIEGTSEDEKNVPFYEKHGFQRMEHGAAIQICNYSDKR